METKGNHEETTTPVLTSSQPHNFDDFRTPTPSSTTFRSGIKNQSRKNAQKQP